MSCSCCSKHLLRNSCAATQVEAFLSRACCKDSLVDQPCSQPREPSTADSHSSVSRLDIGADMSQLSRGRKDGTEQPFRAPISLNPCKGHGWLRTHRTCHLWPWTVVGLWLTQRPPQSRLFRPKRVVPAWSAQGWRLAATRRWGLGGSRTGTSSDAARVEAPSRSACQTPWRPRSRSTASQWQWRCAHAG